MNNFKSFSIVKDDPFHLKKKLRNMYKDVLKEGKELDFSRGEPLNPPDIESDEIFSAFFNFSLELNKVIGDKNLKLATDNEVEVAEKNFIKEGNLKEEKINKAISDIKKCISKYNMKKSDKEIIKIICSEIRGEDYGEPEGSELVRCLVANKIKEIIKLPEKKEKIMPKDVIITLGGSEAIGAILELFFCCGYLKTSVSTTAMISPLYTPYKFILEKGGINIYGIPSDENTGFQPNEKSLKEFSKQIKQKNIKLLIVVNPGNPLGYVLSSELLKRISDICKRNKIIVIEDIVYAQLTLEKMECFYTYYPEGTIIISSGSKFYQETGTRFGYCIISDEANEHITEKIIGKKILKEYYGSDFREAIVMAKGPDPYGTFYHTHLVPTPIQWMGAFRLMYGDRDAEVFVSELKERWDCLYKGLNLKNPSEKCPKYKFVPYYALIDFIEVCENNGYEKLAKRMKEGKIKPEQFFEKLYSEANVLVLPSATFFPEAPQENIWKYRFSVANQDIEKVKLVTANIKKFLTNWEDKLKDVK